MRSPALQQLRQLNLHWVADVDHEFRVGGPSPRQVLAYGATLIGPLNLSPRMGDRMSLPSRLRAYTTMSINMSSPPLSRVMGLERSIEKTCFDKPISHK